MDVFTFEKTPLERLNEFLDILKFNSDTLPASKIRPEWSYYMEIEMEPSDWQAVWKMPRELCEDFKIHYPNLVLVTVKDICFKLLTASVNIIGVQDDSIHLPETLDAELIELWPTKKQEFDTLDMLRTSNCLDKFRFFYNNIWMPWDMYLDDSIDWINEHLKSRLDLYYALRSGAVREPKCTYIQGIIKEAKTLQAIKNSIETELSDNEDEEVQVDDTRHAKRLLQIHLRMKQIQEQVDICENDQMRDLLDISGFSDTSTESSFTPEIYFISQKCTTDDHLKYIKKSQEFLSNESLIQCHPNLENVLDLCYNNDIIILSPGNYNIQSLIKIKDGCTIRGLYSPEETKLESLIENSYFLSSYGNVVLENLRINAHNLQFGVIVAFGSLQMKNCIILGDGNSFTKHGILVSPGCSFEAENCEIYNFSTGIVCNKGSNVIIRDSIIHDCFWGLEVFNGGDVQLVNTVVKNCKEYGVRFVSDEMEEVKGDCNILDRVDAIKIKCSTIESCKISTIAIQKSIKDYDLFEPKTEQPTEEMS